jgi:hypothetical protein
MMIGLMVLAAVLLCPAQARGQEMVSRFAQYMKSGRHAEARA